MVLDKKVSMGLLSKVEMAKSTLKSSLKVKRTLLFFIVLGALVALAGAYYLSRSSFNLGSRAANTTVSVVGRLVKKGTPEYSSCTFTSPSRGRTYALKVGNQLFGLGLSGDRSQGSDPRRMPPPDFPPHPQGSDPRRMPPPDFPERRPVPVDFCVPLVTSVSTVNSLVNEIVRATGVYRRGVFFARDLVKLDWNEIPGPGYPKFTPKPRPTLTPTPSPTPCPGLSAKSTCDPKATAPDKRCCSPLECLGRWNFLKGRYEDFRCEISRPKAF